MALDMIVLGDSITWGQGLNPPPSQDKFWTKTQAAVASLLKTQVNPHVYAHSGAPLMPDPNSNIFDTGAGLWGEVPVPYPSVQLQLYKAQSDLQTVATAPCLVLLNGGIDDVNLWKILSPNFPGGPSQVAQLTTQLITMNMTAILDKVFQDFPQAVVIVPEYYPILSNYSDPLKASPALAVFLASQGLLLGVADYITITEQCMAFYNASMSALNSAVQTVSQKYASQWGGQSRIFPTPSGIVPENALGAPNCLLWYGTDDPQYSARVNWYNQPGNTAIAGVTAVTPYASIGHPNVQGAAAYFGSIQTLLPTVCLTLTGQKAVKDSKDNKDGKDSKESKEKDKEAGKSEKIEKDGGDRTGAGTAGFGESVPGFTVAPGGEADPGTGQGRSFIDPAERPAVGEQALREADEG